MTEEPSGTIYVPLAQGSPGAVVRLVVRTGNTEVRAVVEEVRSIMRSIDPDTPVDQVRTMADLVAGAVDQPRFAARLLTLFALAGLLLGAIGI